MTLLAVAQAQARLFSLAGPVAAETVPLAEAAGRWASSDIVARRTQPAADLSAMDGYAIRFADLPGPWRLVGESAAGTPFAAGVDAGEAVRISTGAALPCGTDTVVIQEDVTGDGTTIALSSTGPSQLGEWVRRTGIDFGAGDTLIAAGERMTPPRLALAAMGGHAVLPVRRRVRVAVAATGNELVRIGTPGEGLPETNRVMLTAMLAGYAVELIDLGIIPDDLPSLTAAFAGVDADLLVTTGGASVGDHDLVRPALIAAGGAIHFWRVAMQPGRPLIAGKLGAAAVLGLPGNPVSAYVTALLFVLPMVAHLAGAADPLPHSLAVPLGAPLPANGPRQVYTRGTLRDGHVCPLAMQDSSVLSALASADCLIVRLPHASAAAIGDMADILQLA